MLLLTTYDVDTTDAAGRKRLRKVARICVDHGQRVQNSVFECDVDAAKAAVLKTTLLSVIDDSTDSLRFYNLGNRYQSRIEHYGVKPGYDPEGLLLV